MPKYPFVFFAVVEEALVFARKCATQEEVESLVRTWSDATITVVEEEPPCVPWWE